MSVSSKMVHMMVFIYRALDDGWTVKKISDEKYEFKKPLQDITEEVTSDDFTSNFLRQFTSVDNFFGYLHSIRAG